MSWLVKTYAVPSFPFLRKAIIKRRQNCPMYVVSKFFQIRNDNSKCFPFSVGDKTFNIFKEKHFGFMIFQYTANIEK